MHFSERRGAASVPSRALVRRSHARSHDQSGRAYTLHSLARSLARVEGDGFRDFRNTSTAFIIHSRAHLA